jgi:hypothetical protein
MIEEPFLDINHILDGNKRKIETVGLSLLLIGGGGASRAFAATQDVGADHKILIRIQGFAGTNDDIPPAGLLLAFMQATGMSVSGEGMADQDGVALFLVLPPIGLIGDHDAL